MLVKADDHAFFAEGRRIVICHILPDFFRQSLAPPQQGWKPLPYGRFMAESAGKNDGISSVWMNAGGQKAVLQDKRRQRCAGRATAANYDLRLQEE